MSPKHESAESRRLQILDAAMTCFGKNGYYQTSMQDIVAESGLSKGAIYWYFKSKKEIFLALMDLWELDLTGRMRDMISVEISPLEVLRKLGLLVFAELRERPEFINTLTEFWSHSVHDRQVFEKMRAYYADWMMILNQLVKEGIASGEIPPGDPMDVVVLLGSVIEGTFVIHMVNPEIVNPERNWLLAVDLITGKGSSKEKAQ